MVINQTTNGTNGTNRDKYFCLFVPPCKALILLHLRRFVGQWDNVFFKTKLLKKLTSHEEKNVVYNGKSLSHCPTAPQSLDFTAFEAGRMLVPICPVCPTHQVRFSSPAL